jgi:hypothetical protein
MPEALQKSMQGRNQAEVIQEGGAQVVRKPFHDLHGLFHQVLGEDELLSKFRAQNHRPLGQGRQPEVDANQGLGDLIVQFAADPQSFLLLGG